MAIFAAAGFRNSSYTSGSRSAAVLRSPAAAASRRSVLSDMRVSLTRTKPYRLFLLPRRAGMFIGNARAGVSPADALLRPLAQNCEVMPSHECEYTNLVNELGRLVTVEELFACWFGDFRIAG
jgi:hypothetical protein